MNRIGKTLATWLMFALAFFPWYSYGDDQTSQPLSTEALQQLVAPIALYPDPLLAQILMASTYPLEVVSAARWVKSNANLKDKALEDALQQQPWDPSVKSLTAVPDVLNMMNDKLDMTQKLGDAFLAQQQDVLDAVQALRTKAQSTGNLKTNKQQVVSSSAATDNGSIVSQGTQENYITILPANPEIVYVPAYDPNVVYGAWPYPAYPPYYYYPEGFGTGMALSFATGVFVGNALWGHCNWAGHNVNINVNQYNRYNRTNITNNDWHHDPLHRGNVPYNNHALQQKYNRNQLQDAKARDNFRNQAEKGRQEMAHDGRDGIQKMDREGHQDGHGNRPEQQLRQQDQDRFNQQLRDNRPQQNFHPENFHENRRPNAFEGINHGDDMHRFSDRGAASRGFHGGGGRRR